MGNFFVKKNEAVFSKKIVRGLVTSYDEVTQLGNITIFHSFAKSFWTRSYGRSLTAVVFRTWSFGLSVSDKVFWIWYFGFGLPTIGFSGLGLIGFCFSDSVF